MLSIQVFSPMVFPATLLTILPGKNVLKKSIIAAFCLFCLSSPASASVLSGFVNKCPTLPAGGECRKAASEAVSFWRALPSLMADIGQGLHGAPVLRTRLEAACARYEDAAAALLRAGGPVGLSGGWTYTRDMVAKYKEKRRAAQRKALFKPFANPSPKGTMKRVQNAEDAWVHILNDNRRTRGMERMTRKEERRARFEFDCLLMEIAHSI